MGLLKVYKFSHNIKPLISNRFKVVIYDSNNEENIDRMFDVKAVSMPTWAMECGDSRMRYGSTQFAIPVFNFAESPMKITFVETDDMDVTTYLSTQLFNRGSYWTTVIPPIMKIRIIEYDSTMTEEISNRLYAVRLRDFSTPSFNNNNAASLIEIDAEFTVVYEIPNINTDVSTKHELSDNTSEMLKILPENAKNAANDNGNVKWNVNVGNKTEEEKRLSRATAMLQIATANYKRMWTPEQINSQAYKDAQKTYSEALTEYTAAKAAADEAAESSTPPAGQLTPGTRKEYQKKAKDNLADNNYTSLNYSNDKLAELIASERESKNTKLNSGQAENKKEDILKQAAIAKEKFGDKAEKAFLKNSLMLQNALGKAKNALEKRGYTFSINCYAGNGHVENSNNATHSMGAKADLSFFKGSQQITGESTNAQQQAEIMEILAKAGLVMQFEETAGIEHSGWGDVALSWFYDKNQNKQEDAQFINGGANSVYTVRKNGQSGYRTLNK